ncbi:MAG: hypothetical protein ACI8QF_004600 [Limisphaerales bacterium]|jgi:uncharacterized protein (TIGR00730 family)
MNPLKRIGVFCGSSPGGDPAFTEAAKAVGTELARRGIGLVYGGGNVGLMGVVADATLESGGEVIGVIPEALEGKELAHQGVTELRVVASMHERKALMEELSDGFVALPGGFGTFEELLEILTWSQLGIHRKPAGILNVSGYYDCLIAMFDHAVSQRLLSSSNRELVLTETEIAPLLNCMRDFEPGAAEKWLDRATI